MLQPSCDIFPPPREAIMLQQEIQNCITRVRLLCLTEAVSSPSSEASGNMSNDSSLPYEGDVLNLALMRTFGGNDIM